MRTLLLIAYLIVAGCKTHLLQTPAAPAIKMPVSQTGSTGNCRGTTPPAARTAGFGHLAFCDDFDSLATIDVESTGKAGFDWYTNLPWGGNRKTLRGTYRVNNSTLNLTGIAGTANWGLSTLDPVTGAGRAWTHGYFEARIQFNPSAQSNGHPSFWMFSAEHTLTNNAQWAEWDIFEAQREPGRIDFAATLHQWQRDRKGTWQYWNGNAFQRVSVDWSHWHTVAGLWVSGRVSWYLDGQMILSQAYSPTASPDPVAATDKGTTRTPAGTYWPMESEPKGMEVILGTEPGWPMLVDWVRVWE